MAASWLDREPGVAVALEQMRRVLEGGIKSAGVSLLLSVAAGAFAVVLVVLFAADFAPRYVLRVVEMDRDPETLVNPKRQLGEYVHTAVFTSKALLPIIERNALFPSLVKTNRRAAIEAFREDIEIEVYENYFLEQRSAHDAPRSARLAVRFRHSNRGVALAVTRELGELVVRHEQKSRQEVADRAARDADAVRDRAERNLSLRRARVVEKQLEVERGGDPLAEVELVSLLGSLPAREREVERASRRALEDRVGARHQGAVAQVLDAAEPGGAAPSNLWSEAELLRAVENKPGPVLLLVLDGVTDPHNLGACLRSADAAGVEAVVVPKDKSADLNATARKVACGAAEVVPFVKVTNISRTLRALRERGVWLYGAAGEAQQSLYDCDLSTSLALVMGAEGSGLRRLTRQQCDVLVRLPMAGSVGSLNVSVAAGICLFEVVRQRLQHGL